MVRPEDHSHSLSPAEVAMADALGEPLFRWEWWADLVDPVTGLITRFEGGGITAKHDDRRLGPEHGLALAELVSAVKRDLGKAATSFRCCGPHACEGVIDGNRPYFDFHVGWRRADTQWRAARWVGGGRIRPYRAAENPRSPMGKALGEYFCRQVEVQWVHGEHLSYLSVEPWAEEYRQQLVTEIGAVESQL